MFRLPSPLCVVTDSSLGKNHIEVAERAIKGGARFIQFREKRLSKKEIYHIALELREMNKRGRGSLYCQ